MMILGSASDLWPALRFAAIGLAVLALIAAIVVWRGRRRGSTTLMMDVALTLSGWWVALSALALVFTVANTLTGAAVTVEASLPLTWPGNLPCDATGQGEGARLLCGSAGVQSPWVMGSSVGVRLLIALSQVCTIALSVVPAVLIGVICFLTLRGRPFARTVTRALTVGAVAVLVFGIAAGILPEISGVVALREIFSPESDFYPESFQLGLSLPAIGGALALAALAAVFREGSRLQQEREQLEQETARLQKDTEGLV